LIHPCHRWVRDEKILVRGGGLRGSWKFEWVLELSKAGKRIEWCWESFLGYLAIGKK
jgi:hypothetical protein